MPENLRILKGRIRTAKNIAQLAKTLEMVSVSKIRRARILADSVRPYAGRITVLTNAALQSLEPEQRTHPYLARREGPRLLLAIGPDKGLCGPLTGNLVRKLADSLDENTFLITVGKRMEVPGVRLAGNRLLASFRMGSRLPEYSLVFELVRVIDEQIRSGKAASLDVLYGRFVSFFTQVPTVQQVLPIGAASPETETEPLVFEPGGAALLDALLPH
ncbi:MAG: F0F1 ATP synthase subunit gamma, partial [Spirochaetia bacterium]